MSSGSGVLAGVIAAIVAWLLWARYMQSDHTISFPVGDPTPGTDPLSGS